jgi:hypothetical protein
MGSGKGECQKKKRAATARAKGASEDILLSPDNVKKVGSWKTFGGLFDVYFSCNCFLFGTHGYQPLPTGSVCTRAYAHVQNLRLLAQACGKRQRQRQRQRKARSIRGPAANQKHVAASFGCRLCQRESGLLLRPERGGGGDGVCVCGGGGVRGEGERDICNTKEERQRKKERDIEMRME